MTGREKVGALVCFGVWLFLTFLFGSIFGVFIGFLFAIVSGVSMIAGWVTTPGANQNQDKGEGK